MKRRCLTRMAEVSSREKWLGFIFGPRVLVAANLVIICLCTLLIYAGPDYHVSVLYFLYLPVAAVSVVRGRGVGVAVAIFTVLVVIGPMGFSGLRPLMPESASTAARIITLATWAAFLIAMAVLVGWVAENGGSLRLSRGLAGRAIWAFEAERRRMGQDIHDGICQYAAAAFVQAEILVKKLDETNPEMNKHLDQLRLALDALVKESRNVVNDLRPPSLSAERFVPTLTGVVEDYEARTGIECEMQMEGDFAGMADATRIAIYRTVQEALANVEKHARAKTAKVIVSSKRQGASIFIQDDGVGFDPECEREAGHHGLSGMSERARFMGGQVEVSSAPGQGTSIVVNIPEYGGTRDG